MRKKIFIFIVLTLILLLPGRIFGESEENLNVISDKKAMNSYISTFDKNFEKKVIILPNSPFYFIKQVRDSFVSIFLFGNKKSEYIAKTCQWRLVDAILVIEKGKAQSAKKAFKAYNQNINKLKRLSPKAKETVSQNYQILILLNPLADNMQKDLIFLAKTETEKVLSDSSISINPGEAQKESIEGKVINNYGYGLVLESENKLFYATIPESLQKDLSISEGDLIKIEPLNDKVYLQSSNADAVNQDIVNGSLEAEKISKIGS